MVWKSCVPRELSPLSLGEGDRKKIQVVKESCYLSKSMALYKQKNNVVSQIKCLFYILYNIQIFFTWNTFVTNRVFLSCSCQLLAISWFSCSPVFPLDLYLLFHHICCWNMFVLVPCLINPCLLYTNPGQKFTYFHILPCFISLTVFFWTKGVLLDWMDTTLKVSWEV